MAHVSVHSQEEIEKMMIDKKWKLLSQYASETSNQWYYGNWS